ncbi:hypothetical protein LEMLEM_LOCUS24281 [Lemmus lemmus]
MYQPLGAGPWWLPALGGRGRARPDGCDSDSDSWPAHSQQALSQGDLTGCLACNTCHKQFPTRHLQSQSLSRLRSSCFLACPLWLRGAAPPTIRSSLPSGVPFCTPSSPRTEKMTVSFASVPNLPVCPDYP